MSISSVSAAATQAAAKPTPVSPTARAADGDFKTKGFGHEVKDADGDYKPTASTTKTSAPTLAALGTLQKGG